MMLQCNAMLSVILPLLSQDSLNRKDAGYSLHQPQGDKQHGTEKSGFLYKKSEGCELFFINTLAI